MLSDYIWLLVIIRLLYANWPPRLQEDSLNKPIHMTLQELKIMDADVIIEGYAETAAKNIMERKIGDPPIVHHFPSFLSYDFLVKYLNQLTQICYPKNIVAQNIKDFVSRLRDILEKEKMDYYFQTQKEPQECREEEKLNFRKIITLFVTTLKYI